jgi:hypothetical protein
MIKGVVCQELKKPPSHRNAAQRRAAKAIEVDFIVGFAMPDKFLNRSTPALKPDIG